VFKAGVAQSCQLGRLSLFSPEPPSPESPWERSFPPLLFFQVDRALAGTTRYLSFFFLWLSTDPPDVFSFMFPDFSSSAGPRDDRQDLFFTLTRLSPFAVPRPRHRVSPTRSPFLQWRFPFFSPPQSQTLNALVRSGGSELFLGGSASLALFPRIPPFRDEKNPVAPPRVDWP